MKKYSALVAAAIGVAGLAASANAATMNLSLTYVGSTTATNAASLALVNLSDPTKQTTAWHHYFSVNVANFTSDPSTSQALRLLNWDVVVSGGGSGTMVSSAPAQTFAAWNPNVTPVNESSPVAAWKDNSDAGPSTSDLQAMLLDQTHANTAYATLMGQPGSLINQSVAGQPANSGLNRIGRVSLTFTGPISSDLTVAVQESAGNSFSWFNANNGDDTLANVTTTDTVRVGGASLVIAAPAVTTPEPASLGVLALGGLSLLARRRRTI